MPRAPLTLWSEWYESFEDHVWSQPLSVVFEEEVFVVMLLYHLCVFLCWDKVLCPKTLWCRGMASRAWFLMASSKDDIVRQCEVLNDTSLAGCPPHLYSFLYELSGRTHRRLGFSCHGEHGNYRMKDSEWASVADRIGGRHSFFPFSLSLSCSLHFSLCVSAKHLILQSMQWWGIDTLQNYQVKFFKSQVLTNIVLTLKT